MELWVNLKHVGAAEGLHGVSFMRSMVLALIAAGYFLATVLFLAGAGSAIVVQGADLLTAIGLPFWIGSILLTLAMTIGMFALFAVLLGLFLGREFGGQAIVMAQTRYFADIEDSAVVMDDHNQNELVVIEPGFYRRFILAVALIGGQVVLLSPFFFLSKGAFLLVLGMVVAGDFGLDASVIFYMSIVSIFLSVVLTFIINIVTSGTQIYDFFIVSQARSRAIG